MANRFEFKYNVTGADRKRLVSVISEVAETPAKYLGMPTAAYQVGYVTIDRTGTVGFDESVSGDEVEQLVERLLELGFEPEDTENGKEAYGLVVTIPGEAASDAAIENIRRILQSKGALIKKAVGADNVDIEVDDTAIRFPWFDTLHDSDMVSAVSKLIGKLLAAAKAKKRIVVKDATENPENEKYAFRCWLLSLGFIGDEYKATRKTLLRNLSGSSAFKSGNPKVHELVERINADAELYDDVMSLQDKEVGDHE